MGRKERDRPDLILALDPSGSFHEGKGTTGILALRIDEYSSISAMKSAFISAKDFKTQTDYWNAHLRLIKQALAKNNRITLVVEDYLLYANKAAAQTSSRMETSQLIGIIKLFAAENNIKLVMQTASEVKNRWADHILEHNGYMTVVKGRHYILCSGTQVRINRHQVDALRHAIHYYTFNVKE